MPGALDGIRVIDFGQYIAGPQAAMFLADQGADVVRIEPPGGPRWDTPANATWNRNKRSIVLDLKDAADLAIARRLVASADVVVENFRPGVMERLGLGSKACLAVNPALVYCSIPGFASDDPRAGVAAWEGVVGAATATYRPGPAGTPIYTAIPFSSHYAAFQAAASIAMALNARERDGLGQVVEVPLFDATFAAIGARGLRVHNAAAADDRDIGAIMTLTRQFLCADGRWFMYHAGNLNAQAFLASVGAAEIVAPGSGLSLDDQRVRLEALFRTKTATEWEALCDAAGTEGAICRTSDEWLDNEQALGSGIVIDSTDPELGAVRGPGVNVRMSGTPAPSPRPRSTPGADREAILATPDRPRFAVSNPEPPLRAALQGIKVVDLCIVLAGPTCGRTLAEFGADVVKIDSPSRKMVAFHNDINRAKQSIVLDLKSEAGLRVFWRLVADADVVVQNFRKGVAERLGIGYEDVRARRPDIVYASLNTYGQVGPWAGRPGHEQIAQAASGMQERFGGDGRPVLAPFAVNDYGTGFMGAYGVALALLHRRRTGEGQHVDSALAYTATMLQSSVLQRYAGKEWNEPRGQASVGSGPLNRAYQASDGWLFLAARPGQISRVPALAASANLEGDALVAALEGAIAGGTTNEWVAKLQAAGIGAHAIVPDVRPLMDDPWVQAHGLSITREHEGFGPITTTGPTPRLSRTPVVPGRPAPRPGSDAKAILATVGLDGELDRLLADGVVVTEGIGAR
ncbi:MAG: CoA transferase [Dehalococcoidia bacterium]